MTNIPPLVPADPNEENPEEPLMEDAEGHEKLDPDADQDRIDSAEADRLAAESDSREE
ncbi:hypothetical protein [Microbacterium sp. 13-71-7]|jgi:hypothetical protein|uniref:hypothetical protein n=1 Tax=Microbacterium sp. 13-71-7 TaxID=1970399 RepID=UPI0025E3D148|nr:hypothetical protein [Microbacterium sp. 13-71-7]